MNVDLTPELIEAIRSALKMRAFKSFVRTGDGESLDSVAAFDKAVRRGELAALEPDRTFARLDAARLAAIAFGETPLKLYPGVHALDCARRMHDMAECTCHVAN